MASMNLKDIQKAIESDLPDVSIDFTIKEKDGQEVEKTATYAHLALVEKEKRELADEALAAMASKMGKRLKKAADGDESALQVLDEGETQEEAAEAVRDIVAIFEDLLSALAVDDEVHAEFIEVLDPTSRKYDAIISRVVDGYFAEVRVGEASPSADS